MSKERISKYLSRVGACSRREAERLIEQGYVTVNGAVITTPVTFVDDTDMITLRGEELAKKSDNPCRVWCYYKPVGLVTTHHDPEGRPTVFESLPKHMPRVISVGRLDLNSEGLLLLTNDGAFARMAEHPKTGWTRVYKVRVFGLFQKNMFDPLKTGVTVEGVHYKGVAIDILSDIIESKSPRNFWLKMTLTEGKNREIRRLMSHIGLDVNRLIRLSYGPFELGDLALGAVKECSQQKINAPVFPPI